ncbi:alpha/beta fold hydrolase [Amycolatopsis sp. RTGN1]|uniref:alpha/beta fold hydrolase n=1 Tax=Amycolatopsis ponsaeliensis TaxID=2992142 RepID=UPI00254E12A9|nr:alpha/beta hydrolase [Amycolatopsis sp. RTGN1]
MPGRVLKWGGVAVATLVVGLAATYVIAGATRATLDEPARAELLRDGKAEHFVPTSQGVLNVRLSGPEKGPVVLLVHGGAVGGQGFAAWRKPLADAGFRVVVPDLLGYGYSERPDVPYTREFYTRQLRELLDGLGMTAPVHVIGASLGGAIATAFTAAHPERVASLALMAPSGGGRSDVVAPVLTWPVLGDWIFRVAGPAQVRSMIADAYPPGTARDEMVAWMAEQTRFGGIAEGILNTVRNYDSTWQPDVYQAVGRSGIPVFAAWGTADVVNPYAQSAQVKQWIPRLELFTLPGQGHAITYGQAAAVLERVVPFLRGAGA